MRHCDTCGGELGDADAFSVCPKCLFQSALGTAGRPDGAAEALGDWSRGRLAAASHLFARRDFFAKYEILERVAGGGQGDIWRVWDSELRRCVAMKRLGVAALGSEPAVYRFLAEAQIASQLEHPGVLPIFDVGLDPDGRPFYTTQLLPGTTLGDVWRRVQIRADREWTIPRALELLGRVCEVMAHAHSRGVIHRDLKPSNVLVGPFGDVRVIDWGSAHVLPTARKDFEEPFVPLNREVIQTDRGAALLAERGSPLATASAGQPITILFMPPEILAGRADELGPQTDIYSVGVMLYELLAGHPPYVRRGERGHSCAPLRSPLPQPADSNAGPVVDPARDAQAAPWRLPDRAELQQLILGGPPEPVRRVNPAVSRDLAAVCGKAMAHTKSDRYPTMQELANDLRAALELRPVTARQPGPILKLQKWAQRNLSYVLLAGAALLLVSVAFFVTRGLRAQRDVARQLTALRGAELAARSGQWRQALRQWDLAEAAGYSDRVYLGLQRAEAWTILSEPAKSWTELRKLAARSDLRSQRGAVLLRLGEHELFDLPTADRGVQHVRQALSAGLTRADEAFAKGLLADSTEAALDSLRQALQFNPYHHGAHRHSLGLEFLLGRHSELADHARLFKVLYPDDPTPGFLEAMELAMHGRLPEAQSVMASLRQNQGADSAEQFNLVVERTAEIAKHLDVDAFLAAGGNSPTQCLDAILGVSKLFQPGNSASLVLPQARIRLAQLPCIRQGMYAGVEAVGMLMIPYLGNQDLAIQKVKNCWRHHPEGWLPVLAGIIIDSRHPSPRRKSLPLLAMQAELFQLGADSAATLPGLPRLARLLATKAQFELAGSGLTNSAAARATCLENLHRAATSDQTSTNECKAYFDLALELGALESASALLDRWERRQPADPATLRNRIRLDLTAGAYGHALQRIEQMPPRDADRTWAEQQRNIALDRLGEVLRGSRRQGP